MTLLKNINVWNVCVSLLYNDSNGSIFILRLDLKIKLIFFFNIVKISYLLIIIKWNQLKSYKMK